MVMSSCWGAPAVNLSQAANRARRTVAASLVADVAGGLDHAVFAPLLVVVSHGFADAVGVEEQEVAGLEGDGLFDVGGEGEEANNGAAGLEADDLVPAQDHRRVVAGVDALEAARPGIVGGEEEGGVAVRRRGFVDQHVDLVHELGEIAGSVEGDAAERGAEAGHEERGGDAFAGDVTDGEAEAAVLEIEDVVVVAADTEGGAAGSGEGGAGDDGHLLREEALLDFAGDLHLAVDALALGGFGGEGVGELGNFEGEAGLAGDGLQDLEIGAGPGGLRALGSESHDAHEAVAAGEGNEELGVEQVEGVTFGDAGHEVPGVGVVAIEAGGLVGVGEVADGGGLGGQGKAAVGRDANGLLDIEDVAAAQEHGDLADVEGVADGAGDGGEQRPGLGEVADLVGELVEHDFGVVGFAEELLVEPLLDAFADAEAEGEDEDEEDEGGPDIGRLGNAALDHGEEEADADDDEQGDLQSPESGAGEGVASAKAEQNADVEGALHNDDVGEGKGREHEEEGAGGANPVAGGGGGVVGDAEVGEQDEDEEQGAHADAHAGGEDAEAASSVFSRGGAELIEGEDEIEDDAEEVEGVDDEVAGDVAGAGEEAAIAAVVVLHQDGGIKEAEGDAEDGEEEPLNPAGAGVDAGALGEVDAEEEQGRGAGKLEGLVPGAAQEEGDAAGEALVDEDDAGEGEQDEGEPGIAVGGAREDDPVAGDEADEGEQSGEEEVFPEGPHGGEAAIDIGWADEGDGVSGVGAIGAGDVDVEDVAGVAVGEDGGPLGKAGIGGAVQLLDAIAGLDSGGAGFRGEVAVFDGAGVGVVAEGDVDALVPVDVGVPHVGDAGDPVAEAGDDPESQKEAQEVGGYGLLPGSGVSSVGTW